ncbi:Chloride channel protein [Caenorhabditis elegans]|uniref:Chloride channel protein n=1 Tax=Caenorhabditis elegans TaxID=6239 RepID=H2L0J1_CAEEL|nr:Chloride channel protein [Caenorhabditis elegans]CCD73176.1 Chloride channel protein [Caenorhabditis elegans]|eukprot:NP_001024886.1 Chloride channel protein [Caenorhabditis elegans]
MNGAPYQQKKTSFVSGASDSEEEHLGSSELVADDDESDDNCIVSPRFRKSSSRSALVRTTSFNHKQYRSIKEMIIDLKQEPGKNGLHGLENGSNHSDRKVTFTLENDLEFPKFRKNRSLWLRMEMNRIKHKLISLSYLLSDWMFLALLGVAVAFISILVDMMVFSFQEIQRKTVSIYNIYGSDQSYLLWGCGLLGWCGYMIGLVAASACFVHYVAPQAIGSGIPEMKTIIRGVILVDYLTLKTLVSKIFGVAMALGSGVPIGKMGPFVHIASVVANQMCLLAAKFDSAYREESRRMECLAAACAVGVACTFSSPVGGVLFSIEVTTMYFSVRSYWRGFFAACCGATTIRLLRAYVVETEVTVSAFYQTSFRPDAFSVDELPLFALLGLLCGILGAGYISLYRCVVLFLRNNQYAKMVFQRHWIVYPIVISCIFSVVSYPHGLGMFSTGRIKFGTNLRDFFANCSFIVTSSDDLVCGAEIYSHWLNRGNILLLLFLFVLVHFIFSIISFTLPVPSGVFLPVFVLGAAIGRFYGEIIGLALEDIHIIHPGIYAIVGAAAFSASVTHTVSVSVMIFEITGQLHFILPVMISVMLSNAVCAYLQPSFFDTIIKIKHLPFLPDIPPSNNLVHTTYAEHIMVTPVKFITKITTYNEIREAVQTGLRLFPVVDSKNSQMLIGTVSRRYLTVLLNGKIGDHPRKVEAEKRVRQAIETIDNHFKDSEKELKEDRRRICSETDFVTMQRKKSDIVTPLSQTIKPLGPGEQKNRFLVVPLPDVTEPKLYLPPVPSSPTIPVENTLKRRNSGTRRNALFSLRDMDEKSAKDFLDDHGIEHKTIHGNANEHHTIIKNYMRQAKKYLVHMQFGNNKKGSHDNNPYDLSAEERKVWEEEQLALQLDLTENDIDPAPIQLVKQTSLYKIHSIFSMLQLSKAYVTDCGRLIGVVALSDLRKALEHTEEVIKTEKKNSVSHSPSSSNVVKNNLRHVSTNVIDILTPPLEVARGTTLETNTVVPDVISSPKEVFPPPPFEPRSSLRQRQPRSINFGIEPRKRSGSEFGQRPEEFVEAVAYLRRKSHAIVIPRLHEEPGESSSSE